MDSGLNGSVPSLPIWLMSYNPIQPEQRSFLTLRIGNRMKKRKKLKSKPYKKGILCLPFPEFHPRLGRRHFISTRI